MRTEKLYIYKDRTDVSLTTYVLDDSKEMLTGKARPAVLICPGGAYMGCSDREGEPVALRFAAMGYHAFVLRYSTYFQGMEEVFDFSSPIEPREHCRYPMPKREIGKSMLIIREHAREWLVNPEKIAICGFSAGGHNCGMFGVNWHRPVITDYLGCEAKDIRPAAMILGYMLSDYVYMKENTMGDPMAAGLFSASNTAFLGTSDASDELLHQVSPARQVSDKTPPAFIWATAADSLVPAKHSLLMANALADAGIPYEIHIFEGGDHGLALATQATSSASTELDREAKGWIDLADAWLMKRFALDLKEMTDFQRMMLEGSRERR